MLDVNFDFTTDTKGYWDHYWEKNDGLGGGGADPDAMSPMLKKYHQILWSKELPNGEVMDLQHKNRLYYLVWKDFDFGSDTIIVDFKYPKYRYMMEEVRKRVDNFENYYEDLIRKSYTIGGTIIFPKHPNSINQQRGMNTLIADRWDFTLECIRRYYCGEESPLSKVLQPDKGFFELFVDFKGYVDFFFLQDCVSDDYSSVNIWCGNTDFKESGLPKTIDDYFQFIEREYAFLEKRNKRIQQWYDSQDRLFFRETQCPYCKHIFMWQKCTEGVYFEGNKDAHYTAICPKCHEFFTVQKHVLLGKKSRY